MAKLFCMIGLGNKYVFGHGPFNSNPNSNEFATSSNIKYNEYFNKQIEYKELQTSGTCFNWLNQSFKAIKQLLKEDNIKNIKAELILFQAGKDKYVKPEGHRKFLSVAQNCEFVKFEESKHEIYMERDIIFNPYIEKVLQFYNCISIFMYYMYINLTIFYCFNISNILL